MDTVYLWVRITIYPSAYEFYKDSDYKELGDCVLHEFCHVFLEPLAKLFMWDVPESQKGNVIDTIERQTQRITNALFALLPENWYTPDSLRVKGLLSDNCQQPERVAAADADSRVVRDS